MVSAVTTLMLPDARPGETPLLFRILVQWQTGSDRLKIYTKAAAKPRFFLPPPSYRGVNDSNDQHR
jgi:hypothetical protein